jgi:hypothetical protein
VAIYINDIKVYGYRGLRVFSLVRGGSEVKCLRTTGISDCIKLISEILHPSILLSSKKTPHARTKAKMRCFEIENGNTKTRKVRKLGSVSFTLATGRFM